MSRTRLRVVLILLALILVAASILSGLLTCWAGAAGAPTGGAGSPAGGGGVPASTPEDGAAVQVLLAASRFPGGAGTPGAPAAAEPLSQDEGLLLKVQP